MAESQGLPQTKNKPKNEAPLHRPRTHRFSNARNIVISIFAIIFAGFFLVFGPNVVDFIYVRIANLLKFDASATPYPGSASPTTLFGLVILGAILGAYVGSLLYRWTTLTARRWERMDKGDRVTLMVGIFAGLVVSFPVVNIFDSLPFSKLYLPFLILGLTIGFAAVSVYILQSVHDILPWYRGTSSVRRSGIKILDTNILIDGRIFDVANAGFLDGEIYVPKFVLEELQYIADHHDALKRNRGRRGLEILRNLQADFPIEIGKYDRFAPDIREPVDARLVRIAQAIGADIVTNDWNLNSVAKLQGVKIMSLNELALTLRPTVLPGETMELPILKEGSQYGQGVGYLDDGTMVVVENGREYIGGAHPVVVTQVIQTERGKMIFAEVDENLPEEPVQDPRKKKLK